MLATIPPYHKPLSTGQAPSLLKPAPLRRRVIRLNLTIQPYGEFIQDVLSAAHQRQSAYVCCANAHMVVEAIHDPVFAGAVNKATWVTGDGVPLLWALRMLYGIRQERVTGLDVLPTLLIEAARSKLPVLFYGSTPQVLERCAAFCAKHHPALRVVDMISPPFRALTPSEEQSIIETITASGAGLVFVALGCPKQEKWMAAVSDRIPAVLLGIGGALPVAVGEQKRAPRWMQRAGLEWFFRLVQEPRRLFGRYAVTNVLFVYYFLRHLLTPSQRPTS
jgi:N-acetylglucosaminyldiphosphoundecaprenol N-acetyl-beta-D-mannosaminyltransferase